MGLANISGVHMLSFAELMLENFRKQLISLNKQKLKQELESDDDSLERCEFQDLRAPMRMQSMHSRPSTVAPR